MVEPTRKNSLREQFNISKLAIEFPWLSISFWIAVTVAGILAFSSLKYALFPDITFPVVVVNASAATFTIVAVFLPVGLMGGVLGQFFKPFGITVSAAVLTSLLVARTLSPLLASRWLKPTTTRRREGNGSRFEQWYRNLLAWSLHHRWMVLGLAILSLAIGLGLIPLIPKGFIPKLDRGEFNITYTAPLPTIPKEFSSASALGGMPSVPPNGISSSPLAGASNFPAPADLQKSLDAAQNGSLSPDAVQALRQAQAASAFNPLNDSLQVAKQLDDFVRKSPQVKDVFTIVGSRQGEPNKGRLYVKLNNDRTLKTADVQNQLRDSLPQIPGVTTSNAILIVDYINQLRKSGLNQTEAILQAGPVRLRPILMTTASTILGMLPLALGLGAGAELRAPMAVAIIGGLTTATLLSLIVVPVVYAVLDDLRNRFSKGKRFV